MTVEMEVRQHKTRRKKAQLATRNRVKYYDKVSFCPTGETEQQVWKDSPPLATYHVQSHKVPKRCLLDLAVQTFDGTKQLFRCSHGARVFGSN